MELELDRELGLAYLRRSREAVAKTVEVSTTINVDIDRNGILVGVELLDLTRPLPEDDLVEKFGVESEEMRLLQSLIRAA